MHRFTKRLINRSCPVITILIIIVYILIYVYNNCEDNYSSSKKVDWHDRTAMAADRFKVGLGEQGEGAHLPEKEKEKEKLLFSQNGFNAHLSDQISLFRSVPDIRHPECDTMTYLSKLPSVSVIIIFYNEHWSTLLRTVHSVQLRSPQFLIFEIILVDDGSEREYLGRKLEYYVGKNLPKVQIVRHKERRGLIAARLTGAKKASGEVLIFLDSHVEPNYNWLPPLLEPIAYNPKTVVCPFIDCIDHDTFDYSEQNVGSRGAFDWYLHYKRLQLLPEDLENPIKPFRTPVMEGGLFAINRKWFWELGGYDPELDIWGGEQYELSFKIWMCGGELLEVPCSRVGHVYRGEMDSNNPRTTNFVLRNYKRVAEVWMDEYAEFVYDRNRKDYNAVDAGDVSDRRAIRKRLQCKSFNWFMKNIAFDILKEYPPIEPPRYAYGTIQSIADKELCLDALNHGHNEEPGLYPCNSEDENINSNQYWQLTWRKDLKLGITTLCLDASQHYKNGKVSLYECHGRQGNQYWFYDQYSKLLVQGITGLCLEANITKKIVQVNRCRGSNINMKWKFGYYNATALKNFYNVLPKS